MNGVVVSKTEANGITRLEVRGDGAGWMILGVDKDTVIVNEDALPRRLLTLRKAPH